MTPERAIIDEAAVLRALNGATRQRPVRLATILAAMPSSYATERTVKATIERLRRQGKAIGSSRQEPYGYYWVLTEEDAREAARGYLAQIRTSAETLRAMKLDRWQAVKEQMEFEFAGLLSSGPAVAWGAVEHPQGDGPHAGEMRP